MAISETTETSVVFLQGRRGKRGRKGMKGEKGEQVKAVICFLKLSIIIKQQNLVAARHCRCRTGLQQCMGV